MINVSIIGATGYTGGELLKILTRHSQVKITHLTSESSAGKPITSIHPWLKGRYENILEKCNIPVIAKNSDIVFFCLPHGTSFEQVKALLKQGIKIVDLSADYRLKNPGLYPTWYNLDHPEIPLLKKAVYGLPEIYKTKIKKASLVANPGCYATSAILALAPIVALLRDIDTTIVVDAKSGVSGAGKKLHMMYQFSEANENLLAYAIGTHRHTPEIEQEISSIAHREYQVAFTPHLIPMTRGILSTCYVRYKKKIDPLILWQKYKLFFAQKPFVVVLPEKEFPETKNVIHTNCCHIGVYVDARTKTIIIVSALDNLIKGASGQAVQNMNIMCGFNESEGLI